MQYKVVQDNDCHWYRIPNKLMIKFYLYCEDRENDNWIDWEQYRTWWHKDNVPPFYEKSTHKSKPVVTNDDKLTSARNMKFKARDIVNKKMIDPVCVMFCPDEFRKYRIFSASDWDFLGNDKHFKLYISNKK